MKQLLIVAMAVLVINMVGGPVQGGDSLAIDWHTFDGGGGYSAGGEFELEGTIGQPDVGQVSGGDFELTGGFWAASSAASCACLSDMNGDGLHNGLDISAFVDCLTGAASDCACAEVDSVPGLDIGDVAVFVQDLLEGTPCP